MDSRLVYGLTLKRYAAASSSHTAQAPTRGARVRRSRAAPEPQQPLGRTGHVNMGRKRRSIALVELREHVDVQLLSCDGARPHAILQHPAAYCSEWSTEDAATR